MKLDEAGVPDESNDNEASVGMRKGSNGELTWSSVKGPPKRGVREEVVLDHATLGRQTQLFTLRYVIPTEHSV